LPDDEKEKEEEDGRLELEWKDYLAIFIASLETFLLPLVILIIILLVLLVVLPLSIRGLRLPF
jgi:hypothetical protein